MRLLLDANLSHHVASLLAEHGIEATHVRDHGLQRATDDEIFDFAAAGDYVLVSEDTDFGEILATRKATRPSVLLLRSDAPLPPEAQATLVATNLAAISWDIEAGALVVFARGRIRVRRLPYARGD